MHDISSFMSINWRSLSQKVAFLSACIGVAFLYLQLDRSPAPGSRAIALVDSPETIANAAIGAIATVLYLRAMYPIMIYVFETYYLQDDVSHKPVNRIFTIGAWLLVVLSAAIAASYGLGWGFWEQIAFILWLSPLIPIILIKLDMKRHKQAIAFISRQRATLRNSLTDLD